MVITAEKKSKVEQAFLNRVMVKTKKSKVEQAFLNRVMVKTSIFNKGELTKTTPVLNENLIDAMYKILVSAGQIIVMESDTNADELFVVQSGE